MEEKIEGRNSEYMERKRYLIEMDLKTAFDVHSRYSSQSYLFKGLAITLLGLLITSNRFGNEIVILPMLFFIIFAFLILDICIGGRMVGLGENIREIEKIFMIEDDEGFTKKILRYIPRDIKLKEKDVKERLLAICSSLRYQKVTMAFYFILILLSVVICILVIWSSIKDVLGI